MIIQYIETTAPSSVGAARGRRARRMDLAATLFVSPGRISAPGRRVCRGPCGRAMAAGEVPGTHQKIRGQSASRAKRKSFRVEWQGCAGLCAAQFGSFPKMEFDEGHRRRRRRRGGRARRARAHFGEADGVFLVGYTNQLAWRGVAVAWGRGGIVENF
jgi:hypothetical protein